MLSLTFLDAILETDAETVAFRPNESNFFETFYAEVRAEAYGNATRYSIFLHPKQNILIRRLSLRFEVQDHTNIRFLANGYQSWSETRWYSPRQTIPRLRTVAMPFMGRYGDEYIDNIPRGRGHLHSWTYTCLQSVKSEHYWFVGSLHEKTGFTIIHLNAETGILTVNKDIAGLTLRHSFPALDLWVDTGLSEKQLFARYAQQMDIPAPTGGPVRGYTSWYRHFTAISETKLLEDLQALQSSGQAFNFFQIDDGWQSAVGDWDRVKPEFPRGMGFLANAVREHNLTPGLWLAPFVASAKSELSRQHPDWLLQSPNGKPLRVGWNPMWGGWYYALDFYNPAVQAYLSGVFHRILDQWGYGLLKLDFLFAVCLQAPEGKSRGQVMWEAMDFLRRQIGAHKMLACGVPLGAAFGLADYCRIGGDVHTAWEHPLLRFLRFRERVSTLASLRNTLNRWALNGSVFHNDPDVFILRKEGQKLSPVQQYTLLTINALLGNVLFTSDNVKAWSPEQLSEFQSALALQGSVVDNVNALEPDLYEISFRSQNQGVGRIYCNLSGIAKSVKSDQGEVLTLEPFETIELMD